MYDDAFKNSHSVSVDVKTPNDINTLFDSITYDKGSSLLRMLESIVGPENFRDALRVIWTKIFFSFLNIVLIHIYTTCDRTSLARTSLNLLTQPSSTPNSN